MDEDRSKLLRALAKMTAHRKMVADKREELQKHASERLDGVSHAVTVSAQHLRDHPNVLTYRYHRARLSEDQTLRAIALRAEGLRASSRDTNSDPG